MTDGAPALSSPSPGRGFRFYLATVGASSAAGGLQNILYPWIIVSYLGLNAHQLGVAQMVAMLPNLLLILLGGAISANRPLNTYLRTLYLLNMLPFVLVAAVAEFADLSYWHVLVYGCLFGILSAFIQPARESLVSRVADTALQQAVARISLVQFSTQALGMLAAGFFDVIGLQALLLIQCGLFIAAALFVQQTLPNNGDTQVGHRRESIREGLQMVWRHPRLLPLMLLVAATGFLGVGAYVVAMPILARDVYGLDAIFFAVMQLCFTAGVLLSNVLIIRTGIEFARPGRALLLSLLLRGVLIALISLAPPLWLALPGLVLWGLFSGTSMMLGRSLTHEESDVAFNSRVVSIYQLCLFGSAPIGAFVCGAITEATDIGTTLLIIGGATMAAALLGIRSGGLWRMERRVVRD